MGKSNINLFNEITESAAYSKFSYNLRLMLEALVKQDEKQWFNNVLYFYPNHLNIIADITEQFLQKKFITLADSNRLWKNVLELNMKIINSQPYDYTIYYEDKDINKKPILKNIAEKYSSGPLIINRHEPNFAVIYEKDAMIMKKNILNDEKNRQSLQEEYQKIYKYYYHLSFTNISKILELLKNEGLNSEHGQKQVQILLIGLLKNQTDKRNKPASPVKKESLDLSGLNLKDFPQVKRYSAKEMKAMAKELDEQILKVRNGEKINLQNYLNYVKKIIILEQEKLANDEHINELYDALDINFSTYDFIESKARFLLQTNLGIDIYPLLQDIADIKEICATSTDKKEKKEFMLLLQEKYQELYVLIRNKNQYERTLEKER